MKILQAFLTGARRATAEFKMVLLLYLINIVAALGLALAFRSVLVTALGPTMGTSNLMTGLNMTTLAELLTGHGEAVGAVFSQILWVSLLYMLVNTFLAGGILARVRGEESPFSIREFLASCGTYLFRFLRLFLIFGLLLLLCAFVLLAVLGGIFAALVDNAASEVRWLVSLVLMMILFLLPIIVLMTVADYAKIGVVLTNTSGMVRAAWRATKFVFQNSLTVIGLQLLMLVVPILLFLVYLLLDLTIGVTDTGTMLVMFVIQQLFILSRVWVRVFFFAGQLELYEALQTLRS